MKRYFLTAGIALIGLSQVIGFAHAQNAPPAPPVAQPGTAPATGAPRTGANIPAPPAPLPGVLTVMVFPFESAATPPPQSTVDFRYLASTVAEGVRNGLEMSRVYSTAMFSPDSLLIERARQESPPAAGVAQAVAQVINPSTGAVDPNLAMQLARLTGMQALMLGSVEEYRYDPNTHKAEIVGSAQLLNATTGDPIRNAAVSGSYTGPSGASEITIAQGAAKDLAQRLLAGLAVPAPPPMAPIKKQPKHQLSQAEEGSHHTRIPGWLPAGVILGILFATVK